MNSCGVIVTKNTLHVGTARKVEETIRWELNNRQVNIEFDIASNPDFLKVEAATNDFLKLNWIVIGVFSS